MDSRLDCGLCLLRPWQISDKPSLIRHANNRQIWRTVRDLFPYPYTDAAAEAFLFSVAELQPGNHIYAIDVDGEAVGGIGIHRRHDVARFSAEIGYWLGETYWRRGIATAAVQCLTAHAMAQPDLYRVFALVFASNPASMRVLEKAGFEREGILKRASFKDGILMDSVLYAITRDADVHYSPIGTALPTL